MRCLQNEDVVVIAMELHLSARSDGPTVVGSMPLPSTLVPSTPIGHRVRRDRPYAPYILKWARGMMYSPVSGIWIIW